MLIRRPLNSGTISLSNEVTKSSEVSSHLIQPTARCRGCLESGGGGGGGGGGEIKNFKFMNIDKKNNKRSFWWDFG